MNWVKRWLFWLPGADDEVSKWLAHPAERNAARQHVSFAVMRSRAYWIWGLAILVSAVVLFLVKDRWLRWLLAGPLLRPYEPYLDALVTALVLGVVPILLYASFLGRLQRTFLWKYLAQRGNPVCVGCGYDLHGQTEPRCPECGRPSEPSPQIGEDRPSNP